MQLISNYLLSELFIKNLIEKNYKNINIQKVILLKRGIYSDIYQLIDINHKRYVFKIYREQFKVKQQLELEINIINFLKKRQFYVTEYVKNIFCNFYITIDLFNIERYAVLMNYKIGNKLDFDTEEDISLYANNIADFHTIGKEFLNFEFLNSTESLLSNNFLSNMESYIIIFMKKDKHIKFFKELFDFIKNYKNKYDIKNLSKNIIHGDLHGGNCLKINNNNNLLFMDFDFCNYDYLLIDVSTYYWSCIIRKKQNEWEIFIKEYIKNWH